MPRKKKVEDTLIPIKFVTEVTESTAQYYSNYVQVAHTGYDFSLTFAKVPSPPTSEQLATVKAGNPIKIEPLMQIIIPVKLIQGIIDALTLQKTRYEKNFGVVEQSQKTEK